MKRAETKGSADTMPPTRSRYPKMMVEMKPAYRANKGESDLKRDVAAFIHESRQIRVETQGKITELQMEIERCRLSRQRFQEACRNGSIWVPPIKFR